jgi:hypothetical protein
MAMRLRILSTVLLLAMLPLRAGADEPATAAVWQKHEYSFVFMGFTSTYSCDGLAGALKRLLIVAGAADVKATPRGCSAYDRPVKMAGAELKFSTLAASGEGEPGAGIWKPVKISWHDPRAVEGADCELVDQFEREMLGKFFTVRNLESHTTCIPHELSGSHIDLRFEVLAAAPKGASAPAAEASLYAYPAKGQSREQQASDRADCRSQAASAASANAGGGQAADAGRFEGDCLIARGYTVR